MAITSFDGEYAFLSNFFSVEVEYDGRKYSSVEAAYQAAKTLDPEIREYFTELTASESKKLGKKVELRSDWEKVKLGIMEELVSKKFENAYLSHMLLLTGDEELIEGNWWNDRYWGVCKGIRQNHLGKILMNIRDRKRGRI